MVCVEGFAEEMYNFLLQLIESYFVSAVKIHLFVTKQL